MVRAINKCMPIAIRNCRRIMNALHKISIRSGATMAWIPRSARTATRFPPLRRHRRRPRIASTSQSPLTGTGTLDRMAPTRRSMHARPRVVPSPATGMILICISPTLRLRLSLPPLLATGTRRDDASCVTTESGRITMHTILVQTGVPAPSRRQCIGMAICGCNVNTTRARGREIRVCDRRCLL